MGTGIHTGVGFPIIRLILKNMYAKEVLKIKELVSGVCLNQGVGPGHH